MRRWKYREEEVEQGEEEDDEVVEGEEHDEERMRQQQEWRYGVWRMDEVVRSE